MISRRAFIRTSGLGALAVPRHAHAQASSKIPRVGWLSRGAGPDAPFQAFTGGLRELGYVIGESVVVHVRATKHGKSEEYRALAAELVASRIEVVLASNLHALEAMTAATKTIPIVAWISSRIRRPRGGWPAWPVPAAT